MWTFLYFYHACTTAICFQEGDHLFFKGPFEKSFDVIHEKEEKKGEQAHFIEVAPLGKIKPMCISEEGTPSYIKVLEWLSGLLAV